MVKQFWAFVVTIVALGLWVPGLLFPLMHIKTNISIGTMGLDEQRSILGSIQSFYDNQNYLLAGLILLFGIVGPLINNSAFLYSLSQSNSARLDAFAARLSKWAMADVFVVAVFIAFLSSQQMPMLQASLMQGFYYFLAYCLLSLVAVQVAQGASRQSLTPVQVNGVQLENPQLSQSIPENSISKDKEKHHA